MRKALAFMASELLKSSECRERERLYSERLRSVFVFYGERESF